MSTSISPSLSMASKKWHTWSRTSPPFSMRCSISCFNSVAFRAGPLNWYMLSSFSQTSLEVSHPLICFSSLGLMESIMSDLALLSLTFHCFVALAEAASPATCVDCAKKPLTYAHASFLISTACICSFHVS